MLAKQGGHGAARIADYRYIRRSANEFFGELCVEASHRWRLVRSIWKATENGFTAAGKPGNGLSVPAVEARLFMDDLTMRMINCAVIGLLVSLTYSGCAFNPALRQHLDATRARVSFVSWNVRAGLVTPREATSSRAIALASRSNSELKELMQTSPRPDSHSLDGEWLGINKGIGAALAGITQDVKVFTDHGQCVHGHNLLVYQVSMRDLECRGWQSKRDAKTGQAKTTGNFIAREPCCPREPLQLDYTLADNPPLNPSARLIDDLVEVQPDLLLGRAHAKIGKLKVPVAYFVLFRNCNRSTEACDTSACDDMSVEQASCDQ